MTRSIIGPNAALRYLDAYNAHVTYWREVSPAYLLAYVDKPEHTPFIEQYAASFPDSMVVARIHHDLEGGFHLKPTGPGDNRHYISSPEEYHGAYGFLGRISNVILNIMNEPSGYEDDAIIDRLVAWMLEYIPLAVASKTKSVLFNWGDRQPRMFGGMMDARFGGILKLAAFYPELFYIGFHLYGPDDITEHLESYVQLCKTLEIKPLRVIGTEFGFDKTNGNASGYKSRGYSGGAFAAWQISQVQHDLSPYIKSGVLVGLNIFQEGNSGGWDSFDYENDEAFKKEIKRAALAGELEPMTTNTTTPSYQPPAFTAGEKYTLQVSDNASTNVRTSPIVSIDNKVATLTNHSIITVLEVKAVNIDYWARIKTAAGTEGWISLRGGIVGFVPYLEPPVIVDPPPVVVPPAPFLEVSSETAARLASNARALAGACLSKATAHKQAAETEIVMAAEFMKEASVWDDIASQTATKAA